MSNLKLPFTTEDIKRILPHRYPFLLLDKVIACEDDSAIGVKNVTMNEWFFAGHFPNEPIMPGVLIIEALAQLAGVAILAKDILNEQPQSIYFVKIESAVFKDKVIPGDTLFLYANKSRKLAKMYFFDVYAKVEEKIVVEAKILATIGE